MTMSDIASVHCTCRSCGRTWREWRNAMRVSDAGIQLIIAQWSHASGDELNLALDLRDARSEIEKLKRQLAEKEGD